MVRRAQVSMEFLMVTGLAMFILASATYFMFDYTQDTATRNAQTQVSTIGYQLVEQARIVYLHGPPSFVTVTASMPEGIRNVYTVENDTLVFELESQAGVITVPVFSDVPIRGQTVVGNHTHINTSTTVVHAGRTAFRVQSNGSIVNIHQIA